MQKSVLIIALAFCIGLSADALLKNTFTSGIPIGLGIPLFVISIVIVTAYLALTNKMPLGRKGLYFLVPGVLFSFGFVLRDSKTILALDLGVVFLSLTLTAVSLTGRSVITAGIARYLLDLANGFLIPVINTSDLLYNYVQWHQLLPEAANRHVKSIMRGLAIGLPITAVFFALFVSADAAFAAIAGKSIKLDFAEITANSTIVAVGTWLAAGYFHTFTLSKYAQGSELDYPAPGMTLAMENGPSEVQLGIVEIATALGLVNLLFFSFVCVQMKYLFGGASLVELTPGLSFAEYARKGFFDLNIAAELVLPLLLVADHLLSRSAKINVIIFRTLAFTLVALLLVVMASALMRMHLYQTEYGQSELRLYTTAFMGWLGMVCVVFSATVLAGKRKYFAFASFVSGLFVVGILHLINPDAMIAVANIAHAKTGKSFDAQYLMSLSNDAVPTIVKNISGMPQAEQRFIAKKLVEQDKGAWHADWRAYNMSRSQAFDTVQSNLEQLKRLATAHGGK